MSCTLQQGGSLLLGIWDGPSVRVDVHGANTKVEAKVPGQVLPSLTMAPPSRAKYMGQSDFVKHFSKLKTCVYQDSARPGAVSSSHYIRSISWNASGTFIATGALDKTLRIWNPEKTNVKNSTELRTPGATSATALERVSFHPINENELASCSTDGMVRFWDIRSKASVGEVKVGEQPFTLAWTPDGNEIVAGRKVRRDTRHKTSGD
jgi:THO complex subunit 3